MLRWRSFAACTPSYGPDHPDRKQAGKGKNPPRALSPRFRARETYRRDKTATAGKAGPSRRDAFADASTSGNGAGKREQG